MSENKFFGNTASFSTPDEVRKKYKSLCQIHHPDKGGNIDDYHALNSAYQEVRKIVEKRFEKSSQCPMCEGSGKTEKRGGFSGIKITCTFCKGSGKIK